MDILPKEVKLEEQTITIVWENHVSEFSFTWFQRKGTLIQEMFVL